MHPSLLRNISQGAMLMERSYAQAFFPLISSLFTGEKADASVFSFQRQSPDLFYASRSGASANSNGSGSTEKRIAMIPLKGAIIKYDEECGNYGTETVANWIRSCNDNAKIDAIVLDVDSGGGMGSAVDNPSTAIAECSKPIIAYCGNGMTASAAYWIAAHCDELYATYANDEIGSIGTYVTLADYKKYYKEKHNLEIKELYASKSTEKNKLFKDAIESTEGEEKLIKEYIDPFNEVFIDTVKAERTNVEESVFTGKLFRAKEAQEKGLIDGLKTFNEVLQRAAELAA
jgi:signal peptide peptidase SppA